METTEVNKDDDHKSISTIHNEFDAESEIEENLNDGS